MQLLAYSWDWGVVTDGATLHGVLIGAKYTLIVSALSLLFGSVIGLVAATIRLWRVPVLNQLTYVYVDFFRTTPALVQLIWIFYVLPILMGVSLSAVDSGVIALSLNAGAFLSEIFRGGLVSIEQGQHDAAFVLGLSRLRAMWHVIVPQALRRVLPAVANVFISLLKDSALLSVIAVSELTYQAQADVARTFRPLEFYTLLAVAYFVLTYPISLLTTALERRFRVS